MLRTTVAALFLLGAGLAPPAAAGGHPPTDAQPLSKILHGLEQEDGFSHFEEIEWGEDGYWEIEYVTTNRVAVEIKVRPTRGRSQAPSGSATPPADPSAAQPLTRDACETAGMAWNDNRNVCGVD